MAILIDESPHLSVYFLLPVIDIGDGSTVEDRRAGRERRGPDKPGEGSWRQAANEEAIAVRHVTSSEHRILQPP
jgi:hypothetical protein